MATMNLTLDKLFKKLLVGTAGAMIRLVFGYFVGGIFESMEILTETLPWQEFTTFLGAICGFIIGTQVDLKQVVTIAIYT